MLSHAKVFLEDLLETSIRPIDTTIYSLMNVRKETSDPVLRCLVNWGGGEYMIRRSALWRYHYNS